MIVFVVLDENLRIAFESMLQSRRILARRTVVCLVQIINMTDLIWFKFRYYHASFYNWND